MKTLADLEEIRRNTLNDIKMRVNNDCIRIEVGMGTCGIAAGAREVMLAFIDELQKRKIYHVNISAISCIGNCIQEPIVNVIDHEGNKIAYVNMNPEKATKVVLEHIENGQICRDYT